ncbi:MAG TPA: hypothetical protein VJB82_01265 [Candidatus Peribacterales bacterium]|nr:hypothetical protein [Candidatus Peribacterales bacterium]
MISVFLFFGVAILLTAEGRLLCSLIAGTHLRRCEQWALGLPLGAFLNALLYFVYTVIGIPLTALTTFGGHLLILLFAGVFTMKMKMFSPDKSSTSLDSLNPKQGLGFRSLEKSNLSSRFFSIFMFIFVLFITIKLFYGVTHALLPTYYYDSVSQWTMRAKISYLDHAIAFDTNELRGISKPQYPIFLHSIQITFALGQGQWIDLAANSATLLLSLMSFLAFFLLLMRYAGIMRAGLALGLVLTIPLISLHLGQGYGDVHVLTSLLLAAALLCLTSKTKEWNPRLLLLSALFISSAAWMKQDGIIFGVVPWIAILGVAGYFRGFRTPLMSSILPSIIFASLWSILLVTKGLPLSPHGGGDFSLTFHGDAVPEAFRQLFAAGSFGVHWYLAIALLVFSVPLLRKTRSEDFPAYLILLWSALTFFGALIIFLATPNVQFLVNAQTFSRTMIFPLSLLLLATSMILPLPCARDSDGLA